MAALCGAPGMAGVVSMTMVTHRLDRARRKGANAARESPSLPLWEAGVELTPPALRLPREADQRCATGWW
jgi:hypothetical protein